MLSSQVKFSTDRQKDRQTDADKTICPLIYPCRGIKNKFDTSNNACLPSYVTTVTLKFKLKQTLTQ